jgi:hypothetical protein
VKEYILSFALRFFLGCYCGIDRGAGKPSIFDKITALVLAYQRQIGDKLALHDLVQSISQVLHNTASLHILYFYIYTRRLKQYRLSASIYAIFDAWDRTECCLHVM